jgi:GTPase SAR1 family protein
MDQAETRIRTNQLVDDLGWLEEHVAGKPDMALARGRLRLAAALVRNVIAPYLDHQAPHPLHVAVVGGAGAGKSTIANWLIGDMVAESNPQAGFTRHPIAYGKSDLTWPSTFGFLGPLKRLDRHESARLDEDVYQVRRLGADRPEQELLQSFVIWDCPDVTTWAASHYVPRVVEIAGLADVVVYVASDERYNDEVPTEYLRLFLEAGKLVVAVLVKMREADVPRFLEHFQREVVAKLPGKPLALVTVPQLTREELAEPFTKAARFRIPLINQMSVLGRSAPKTRANSVAAALSHLKSHERTVLSVAQEELTALDGWRLLVQEGQLDFTNRYRKEYLTAERFRRFDETLVRLLELLELPKVGQILSKSLNVLRMPYTLIKSWIRKEPIAPQNATLMERPVLEAALHAWVDQLRKVAAVKKDEHALWKYVSDGFHEGLGARTHERFDQLARVFHTSLTDEVERTARSILDDLQKNPVALNTLRGTKFALDLGAVIGGAVLGGFTPLSVLLVPMAASVTQYLVDLLGENYVTMRREETRMRQQALFTEQLAQPLADWLIAWPTSGGSSYERLLSVVRRYPGHVEALEKAVAARED